MKSMRQEHVKEEKKKRLVCNMRDNQHASDYLVHFSGLALCCSWGEPALRYRFYKGLFTSSNQRQTQQRQKTSVLTGFETESSKY
jgi:hypothetical protein